jgi:hypothetical protein
MMNLKYLQIIIPSTTVAYLREVALSMYAVGVVLVSIV